MPGSNDAAGSAMIDLPALTPFEGGLQPDGDYDALDLDGLDLSGQLAQRARLTRSRMHDCDVDAVDLRDALITECVFDVINAGALNAAGANWRDVRLQQVRIGSLQAFDTTLTRVTVRNARLDFVNLRSAQLDDVRFEKCRISDLDLGSVTARRVSFVDCHIDRVDCFQADLDHVDFSESQVETFNDLGHLRGAVINPAQVVALAGAMASHLGLSVRDGDEIYPLSPTTTR